MNKTNRGVRTSPECHPTRRMWAKGLCNSCYKAEWRKNNPGKDVVNAQKRLKADPDTKRRSYLLGKYGLTVEEYKLLLDGQGGTCAICRKVDGDISLSVDHDHMTGKIRGLLCSLCNKGLGHFDDNPVLLQQALDYLTAVAGIEITALTVQNI